ncbi:DUF4126 family protein [Pontibacter silvestris]|uniref:DUF4126 family protein n=1 Tax=Pontibacter silvestris TaxID=2305183 RepID=A0ABW4WY05_9BACT|nr:DUF4126 family protein [Pontibacter silvestris]MCC9135244.1 DUF4126 family protein [Pontibacter silvestris]
MKKIPDHYLKALSIGAVAGMRSLAAPAMLSNALVQSSSSALEGSPLKYMQYSNVASILKVISAAEMAGDKVPSAPDRIMPSALSIRGLSGAFVGAVVFKAKNDAFWKGALVGATGAVAASYAAFYIRKYLTQKTGVADPVFGAIEDALVVKAGASLSDI